MTIKELTKEEIELRMNEFYKFQDYVFSLFKGSLSFDEISNMNYKVLLKRVEARQRNLEKMSSISEAANTLLDF